MKQKVSQFETSFFLGQLNKHFLELTSKNSFSDLKDLKSPLRQLYYLAALNVTSLETAAIRQGEYSPEEWSEFVDLLNAIEDEYSKFFIPKDGDEISEEWIKKRKVALSTFSNYFNQGPLNYEEQVIEKVIDTFTPFNTEIRKKFGLEVSDFVSIYNAIDGLHLAKFDSAFNRKPGDQTWTSFVMEMKNKKVPLEDWNDHLPENHKRLFETMYDRGIISRFSISEFVGLDLENIRAFVRLFTINRVQSDFLYYSQPNPLHAKPLYQISEETYQAFEIKQIIHSVFSLLNEFCLGDSSLIDRYTDHKGKVVENKAISVLKKFLPKEAIIFSNYFVENNEQDVLVLYKKMALIIEVKAYKKREPLREPERAYDRIKDDFKASIQYGYDQTYRIKKKFIEKIPFDVQDIKKRVVHTVKTEYFKSVFSIIITQEKYGQIQTDLCDLLNVPDEDNFPWSIHIDDFEVFILALVKLKKDIRSLITFLEYRQLMHCGLICGDELETCGAYLAGKLGDMRYDDDEVIFMSPDDSNIFDTLYQSGLGFEKEKNIEKKTSGKFLFI